MSFRRSAKKLARVAIVVPALALGVAAWTPAPAAVEVIVSRAAAWVNGATPSVEVIASRAAAWADGAQPADNDTSYMVAGRKGPAAA